MSFHLEGKLCSDRRQVLVLNDPPHRGAAVGHYAQPQRDAGPPSHGMTDKARSESMGAADLLAGEVSDTVR